MLKLNIQLFGGRGARSSINSKELKQQAKDINMTLEQVINNSRNGGVSPQDYIDMIKYQRKKIKENKTQREITSITYKKAQKRLQKDIDSWFGKERR